MKNLMLNEVSTINIGKLAHGGLTEAEAIDHFKTNGSPSGFLIEKVLPKHFKNLSYSKGISVIEKDEISIKIHQDGKMIINEVIHLYDQKTVTSRGVDWNRSRTKGVGRASDSLLEHNLWMVSQIFIFTDITELPLVKVIAISGTDLLKRFPKNKVGKMNKDLLFSEE